MHLGLGINKVSTWSAVVVCVTFQGGVKTACAMYCSLLVIIL